MPKTLSKRTRVPWTEADLATVARLYADTETCKIAAELGRSIDHIYRAALRLGLRKSAAYLASPAACRLRRGDGIGKSSRFLKGHVPANKGLRRPGWAPGRMAETQFKRGERKGIAAKNWRPIGTIVADSEGYLRIKVREAVRGEATGFGNTKVWPLLARHTWEQHHGPIPKGFIVRLRDGDRSNCAIDNLELLSLADNARRNSMWAVMPREVAEVIQLNGALKRKLRKLHEEQNGGSTQPSL